MKSNIVCILLLCITQTTFAQINLSGFYPTSNGSGIQFGTATAIHENTLVVSSATYAFPPITTGYVYVFNQNNESTTQEAYFYPSDALSNDQFGKTVTVFGDFIAVGSPLHDEGFTDSGAVYLYEKVNNAWVFLQKITASDASTNKQFGSFVKMQGNSLFIVAPNDENNDGISAVYVYIFDQNEWTFSQKLTVPNNNGKLGKIVIQGDNLIVSNFSYPFGSPTKFHTFNYNSNWIFSNSTEQFGNLEQMIFDFTYDQQRLFISVHEWNSGINNFENKVYIYNQMNNSWEFDSFILANYNDFIIGNVAVSGDNLLIGFSNYYLQLARKFPVFYYKKIENEWQMQTNLFGEGQFGMDDYLGNSISMFESNAVIGAPNEGIINSGKAYVFDLETLSSTQFDKKSVIIYPNPTADELHFENLSPFSIENIDVISTLGKVVQSIKSATSSISLQSLPTGLYLIRVQFDNGIIETYKVSKN
jgi:hypothetical protein